MAFNDTHEEVMKGHILPCGCTGCSGIWRAVTNPISTPDESDPRYNCEVCDPFICECDPSLKKTALRLLEEGSTYFAVEQEKRWITKLKQPSKKSLYTTICTQERASPMRLYAV